MPDVEWNREKWGNFAWAKQGEEWSRDYGGVGVQWSATLMPRLWHLLPAGRVVEIAPGYGRWTSYLLEHSEHVTAYDLNSNCVSHCKKRFASAMKAGQCEFFVNDGMTLPNTSDGSVSFVFSFDSLVHVEQDVVASYLIEISRILGDGGYAFLHHSNLAMHGSTWTESKLGRGLSVSAETVRQAAREAGLTTVLQELVSWQSEGLRDCFSLLCKTNAPLEPLLIRNDKFWSDAYNLKDTLAPWHKVVPVRK